MSELRQYLAFLPKFGDSIRGTLKQQFVESLFISIFHFRKSNTVCEYY